MFAGIPISVVERLRLGFRPRDDLHGSDTHAIRSAGRRDGSGLSSAQRQGSEEKCGRERDTLRRMPNWR
jgi:hypothetical protein